MPSHHTPVFLLCASSLFGCGEPELERLESIESAASLPGSNFEIDTDANLVVDQAGRDDWVSIDHGKAGAPEVRKNDLTSGRNDDSYGGGAKEDDPCPPVGTGSIPNNKSDLKTFGLYVEPGGTPGNHGFLHLFWTRVQEPTGTTLMDFEFNQSSTHCGNGVNPVRTPGDFLLEYKLEQGGSTATIKLRKWTGSAWGPETDVTNAGALGEINDSAIAAGDADGLGALSARTFGEASLDLDVIFSDDECESFGSAFVKSRSSDAFTSQLKDFIAPTPISITNCGKVVIRKQTDPDGAPGSFSFSHNLQTDPPQAGTTFQLGDGGVQTFSNVLIGTGYTVTETVPTGFDLTINCDASSGVTTTISGATVSFNIDDPSDVVDCTYTNRARGAIRITKTRKHAASATGSLPHANVSFQITSGNLPAPIPVSTDANGEACVSNLSFGDYTVTETVPDGYAAAGDVSKTVSVTTSGSCAAGAAEVQFLNLPLTTITVAVDSIVPGGTASTISCTGIPIVTTDPVTGDGGATLSAVRPGTYTCTIVVDP